jgi:putative ABC transport system permease protein
MGLLQDIRYGVRVLRRQPGVSLLAMLTMALGIGATTALFSVTYGVLLKPLPWPHADRLVRVTEARQGHEPRVRGTMSNGPYRTWMEEHSTIDALGGWLNAPSSTMAIDGGEPSPVPFAAITPSLLTVLDARPFIGRAFVDDDVPADGSKRVVLLSYGLWQERFGGMDSAVGRVIHVDGKPVTVVGVMPKTFAFPDWETRAWRPWVPPPVVAAGVMQMTIFSALARLRPGVTPEQASAEATARARNAPDPGMTAVALFGGNGPADIRVVSAIDLMTADVRPALLVMLAAVGLLFVTATANVASLQLAWAASRRREMAIRAAIGAGAARLTRQLIVESALIGAGGGTAGIALALALHRLLPSILPADFPRADAVAVDWRVVLFAVTTTILASVACGLLPARHARSVDLVESLCEDGNAPVGGNARTRTARTRTLIMAGQLMVSCVLLVGAALLARSFVALLHTDRGYDPTNVLTARVAFPSDFSMERRIALLEHVADRVHAMPGVASAAFGNALPLLTSGGFRGFKWRPPVSPSVEVEVNVIQRVVGPAYFSALGLRLVAGRTLSASDTLTAPMVVVANRSFAVKYLGANPVGTVVPDLGMCRGRNDRWTVVGVVEDMRQSATSDASQPELFLPARQVGCANALSQAIVLVRTSGDPLGYAPAVRTAVREQEPALAVDSVMTMENRVMRALAKPRLYAIVLTGFAAFAVAIAAVGLFGVLSFSVAQRSREIGVRTALGARPADIVRLVLRQTAVIAAAGIGAGLWAAYALSRLLTSVLYGVNPHDAATYAVVGVALAVVTALACIAPARRAARLDPLRAMR